MEKLKTIQVKTFDDGEVGFDMIDILEGMTTKLSTVHYYSLVEAGDSIILTLYNKNKRKIKLKRKA